MNNWKEKAMHEDQSLPSYVNQRVLALHRYAIALKQDDLDGVAAVLHAAEQDHALGKMIQEFNAIAQQEDHIMISPQSISHVQELCIPIALLTHQMSRLQRE